MIRILEALDSLPTRGELRARTDRRPVHLLAMLRDRGYEGTTTEAEPPERGYVTHIHPRAS